MKRKLVKGLLALTAFFSLSHAQYYDGYSDEYYDYDCNSCACIPEKRFFVSASYLYWAAHQDGLKFAVVGVDPACCESETALGCIGTSPKCADIPCEWKSGFRLGGGFANPCCDWEVWAFYTHYQNSASRRVIRNECDISPYWFTTPMMTTISCARGDWDLKLSTLDAVVRHEFCVSDCFTFRLDFGLKAGWTDQHFRMLFDLKPEMDLTGLPTSYKSVNTQDFCGVGPRCAVTASAFLIENFSLYGNFGLSTLWGEYKVKRSDGQTISGTEFPSCPIPQVCTKCDRHRITPVLETQLGIRWETCFCCGLYEIYLLAAWEHQVWFDHNDFIRLEVNKTCGNLSLHGLTAEVGFAY